MSSNGSGKPHILIVDDEPDVAETYALRIGSHYRTAIATGGEEALEMIDTDIDAVLLDRRMPDIHGDDVLETIRERGYDCPVIMVTAVDPEINILEMDFDDYLCKPILKETLLETLEKHLDTTGEQGNLDEFLSLISKIDVLEAELSRAELATHEEYTRTKQRAEDLGAQLRDEIDDLNDLIDTYRDIARES